MTSPDLHTKVGHIFKSVVDAMDYLSPVFLQTNNYVRGNKNKDIMKPVLLQACGATSGDQYNSVWLWIILV